MDEPEPMTQIHKIRRNMYEETKHMSHDEYLKYIEQKASHVDSLMSEIKPAKDLETFFASLKKQQAS